MKNTIYYILCSILILLSQNTIAQNASLNTAIKELKLESVCAGEATTIELVTKNAGLNFRWEVREDRYFHPIETDDARFGGIFTSVLQINSADAKQDFRCIISDGSNSLETAPIRLNINNPVIRRQPANQTAYINEDFSMTMVATGLNLAYQWQKQTEGGAWENLEDNEEYLGANRATLAIHKVTEAHQGISLRCIVTGGDCGDPETIITETGRIRLSMESSPMRALVNPAIVTWYSNQQKTYINGNPNIFINGSVHVTGRIVNDPVTSNYFFLAQDGNDMYVTGNITNDGLNTDTNPDYLNNKNTHLFHPVADKTKLIMTGSDDAIINGTSDLTSIYHLKTDKAANTNKIELDHDIHIRSLLEFGLGDVELNGHEVELDFTPDNIVSVNVHPTLIPATASQFPSIMNETEDNRIIDAAPSLTQGGVWVGQRLDNDFGNNALSPFASGYGFGNIGLEITANGVGGATTSFAADSVSIYRRLLAVPVTSPLTSIDRIYIMDKENPSLATDEYGVKLSYLDNDIVNGEDENGFSVYYDETNTIDYYSYPADILEPTLDEATTNVVEEIEGYWTLAECPDLPQINFSNPETDVCWDETITIPVNLTGGAVASYSWYLDGNLTTETGPSFTLTGSPDSMTTQYLSVIVISNFGCRVIESHIINHLQTPFVDLGDDSYLCENESITLNAQNNVVGTVYEWTVDGVATGTSQLYTYTSTGGTAPVEIIAAVTNSLGCTRYDTIIVTEAVNPAIDLGAVQTVCTTGDMITLDATPNNIMAGDDFDYDWSTSDATPIINPSIITTNSLYSVTVTNTVSACSTVENVNSLLSEISLSAAQVDILCFGDNIGSIDLTATTTESTATLTYLWDNGATTEDLSNLLAGNYNVIVSDDLGCSETLTLPVSIIEPAAPLSTAPVVTDVLCKGGNTGLISSNPAGGTAPYTFAWSNGATTQDINTLTVGIYHLTVTDANACTTVLTETVAEPSALGTTQLPTHITCNGEATGTLGLSVFGGVSPYTYLWSNGATTQDLTNITAGTYTVTVTDANACTIVSSETIIEPPATAFDIETITNVSCNGANDGSITLDNTVTGTTGLAFSWLGQNTGATASGSSITGLAPDTYDVTVTNTNACIATFTYTITEPLILEVTNSTIVDGAGCIDNGAIDITIVGGTTPYTYSWTNGATTQDIGSLAGGSYTVTITDANNCTYSDTYTVNESNAIAVTETQVNVSCNGVADGFLSISVIGGNAPFTYDWTLADGSSATTASISNLIPGNYQLLVTDDQGCSTSGVYTITQPAALVVGGTETNNSCNGSDDASIQTTVMGGTTPYTYAWSANTGSATTADVSNLSPGTYVVTVTDANNCMATESFAITEPAVLAASPTVYTSLECNGDVDAVVGALASGGTMPYTYQWAGGPSTEFYSGIGDGTYEVTVTDANNCTVVNTVTVVAPPLIDISLTNQTNVSIAGGSDGAIDISVSGGVPGFNPSYTFDWTNSAGTSIATTEDITGLALGTYTVVVTDSKNCTATTSFTISEPGSLIATLDNSTNITCKGASDGTIDISIIGGVAPFTYVWSTASNNNYATTEDLTNLPPDTYSLMVTDANGAVTTLVPDVVITEPLVLTATTNTFDVSCNGGSDGSINVIAAGGTAPYSYTWSNAAPNNSQNLALVAGAYTVTVTDGNGCTTELNNITINEPTAITLSGLVTNATASGASDGMIDLTATGGTPPYSYDWDDDNTIGDIDPEDISGLGAGTYTVIVTDNNGCTATTNFVVEDPTAIAITIDTANDPLCNGDATGSILVSVTGGVVPYTYLWDNGATTEDLTNLSAGTYVLTVTDANTITQVTTVVLNEPMTLTESATINEVSCSGNNNGSIQVTAGGGTAPYTYNWSNGVTTSANIALAGGDYTLTITDANSCELIQSYTINEPTLLSVSGVETSVAIAGGNDGAIDLSVTGGTPAYTYAWSNGATTEDINSLIEGTYTVTITDANGCTETASYVITEPTQLVATLNTSSDVSCFAGTDGGIDIEVSGGFPPYTYLWSNGTTTEDLTNLTAGTYTVIVTDANGAVANLANPVIITEPTELTDSPASITNVSCNGENDGNVTMNPTGGVLPYTYAWSNSLGTNIAVNNVMAGTYTVTITDANGCTITRTNTVTEPSLLAVSGTVTNVAVFGQSTGGIDITTNGGTPTYTYVWSNGATTEDLSNIPSGTYDVTVTDANNCMIIESFTVSESSQITITTDAATSPSCNGFADGSLTVIVTGGVLPYTYDWDNDGTSDNDDLPTISGLTAGTYNLTVTDANGAVETHTITLTEPTELTTAETIQDVSCNGEGDGIIAVSPSGGSLPYTISWSTGESSLTINNLTAGTYNYTVTDNQGCMLSNTITVTEPATLSATETIQDATCDGLSDGQIALSVVGGSAPYNYVWSNGQNTNIIDNLVAGDYAITITDANNCSFEATYTISQPSSIIVSLATSTDSNCGLSDGSITVTASGGTAPYTYMWTNPSVTGDVLSNIPSGSYEVVVTDAVGCMETATFSISDLNGPTLTLASQTNVDCFGENTGAIATTTTGGTAPLTYLWSNGVTTENISNLAAGNYTLILTDASGCEANLSVNILENAALGSNITSTDIACFQDTNGAADLFVNGGVTPYTYAWSNGATTEDLSNVAAGTYEVTITDAVACTTTNTVTLIEPSELTSNPATITTISCNSESDGSISVSVSGGSLPYTYAWSDGLGISSTVTNLIAGTYEVTITDANNCAVIQSHTVTEPNALSLSSTTTDIAVFGQPTGAIDLTLTGGTPSYTYEWSNGATTEDLSSIPSGTYSVTVTDANNCTLSETFTISESSELSITIDTAIDPLCNGLAEGSVSVTVSGGAMPYTFDWDNDGIGDNDDAAALTGLVAGTYNLTVTDTNGAVSTETITLSQPTELISAEVIQDVSCNAGDDGLISITATGGTAPYTISWSTGASTMTIDNLTAGTYDYTITDDQGCSINNSITITEPEQLTDVSVIVDATCNGEADGQLFIAAIGGFTPYTYGWSNGATTNNITDLPAGDYTLTITDGNNCSITTTYTISEPSAIVIDLVSSTDTNCGESDGNITVSASGGDAPYAYTWTDPVVSGAELNNIPSGSYEVVVTDNTGCTKSAIFSISDINGATLELASQTDVNCFGENTGAITTTTTGGTAPLSYLWSNGETTENVSNLAAGNYTLTLTDGNGCVANLSTEILENTEITSNITSTDIACYQDTDGAADLSVSGGQTPYTYAWSNGATTEDLSNVAAGTYEVTITDAVACEITNTVTLTESPEFTSNPADISNVSCNGESDGSITVSVSGGVEPYTYTWANGLGISPTIENLSTGVYEVTITDANNCAIIVANTITEPDVLAVSGDITNVTIFGEATGSIDVSHTGGTLPYTYAWSSGEISQDLSNVAAGDYTVTITDANNCTASEMFTIVEPSEVMVTTNTATTINPSCSGSADGSLSVNVVGGEAPYTFDWDNDGVGDDDDADILNGLIAGTYNVTVVDANGAVATHTITLTEPTELTTTEDAQNISCNGDSDASIAITPNGGTAPYTISWSSGQNTMTISNLVAGTYDYTLTDDQGCSVNNSITIIEPDVLTESADIQNASCGGVDDGSIALTVMGGTPPFQYLWSDNSTNATAGNLAGGTYDVTITDASNCSITRSYTITQPAAITVSLVSSMGATCNQADGSLIVEASGGVASYTYEWLSPSVTGSTLSDIASGAYEVVVTDAQGCTAMETFTISDTSGPVLEIASQTDIDCFGESTGAITTTITSGTAPLMYEWSTGETTTDLTNLAVGDYALTVTDGDGCSAVISTEIIQNEELLGTIESTTASCNGGQDGTADLSVLGGTAPYTFTWSTGATTEDLSDLTIGTYDVTITDGLGCTSTSSVELMEATQMTASETITNVSCYQAADGMIDLTIDGGLAPYSYDWADTNDNVSSRTGLDGGDYEVTVTDQNNCAIILSYTITEPSEISLTFDAMDSGCFDDNSGSVSIQVSNGTGSLEYIVTNVNTNATITQNDNALFTDLEPADYTIQVTTLDNGCMSPSYDFTITESSEIVVTPINSPISCTDAADGSIGLMISGGTAGYIVNWSNGAMGSSITGLSGGDYTATITDANNCSVEITETVVEPDAIQIDATVENISCAGAFDGSIALMVTGGSDNYNYAWSTGQNVSSISNLAPGTYEVTVSEAANASCLTTETFTLTEPDALEITDAIITEASCGGTATGMVDITVAGGTSPYSFDWTNDAGTSIATTEDLSNSDNGDYTVVITDANGCTTSDNYFIDNQASIQVTEITTDVSCAGLADGEASLSVTGGNGNYTFNWSGVANSTDQNQTGLAAGTYDVTVNDTNESCEQILTITIDEPATIVMNNTSITDITCTGAATGAYSFTVNGGPTGNFVFDWESNDGSFSDQTLIPEINNLPAGTYTVTASDGACSQIEEFTISATDVLAASVDISIANCNSTATVLATGGVAPYNYTISPDPNGNSGTNNVFDALPPNVYSMTVTDDTGCEVTDIFTIEDNGDIDLTPAITEVSCAGAMDGTIELLSADPNLQFEWNINGAGDTNLVDNLDAGTYDVTITNNDGCTEELSFTLTNPSGIVINTISVTPEVCFGGDDGEITIDITGGNNPTIAWSSGEMNQSTVSGLAAGNYTVTVGEGGCEVTEDFVINSLDEIQIDLVSSTEPACGESNGYLEVVASGGNPSAYNYLWSDGVPNDNEFIENLGAGDYTVTVTDGNMCSATAIYTLTTPDNLTATVESTNVICFGANDGTITITATGGSGGNTYSIDGSNFQTSNEFTGLAGGTYDAIVEDQNGCSFNAGTFEITEPNEELVVTGTTVNSSGIGVADGSIDLTVTGGEMPYTFAWSNGLTSEDIMDLVAGDYTVTLTDNRGCEVIETFTISVSSTGVLEISTNLIDISCFDANDGELEVIITGGVPPYSITWTYPDNSTVLDETSIQNLGAGEYSVEVMDANSLTETIDMLVLTNPSGLTGSASVTDACDGLSNGALIFNINGGTLPYTYEWTVDGNTVSIMDNDAAIDSILNLGADSYTNISVTDNNNCSILLNDQTITESIAISIAIDYQNDVSCTGLADGFVSVTPSGGVVSGNYNFTWTDDVGTVIGSINNLSNLSAGTYTVVVTDDIGCGQTEQITINEPAIIEATSTVTNVACFGEASGSISITDIAGGSGSGYTWEWEDGSTDVNDRTDLIAGMYSLTITDGNNCTETIDFDLTQPLAALSLDAGVEDEFCFGENNGFIGINTTGGTMPYTYLWSNGETTDLVTDLVPGAYSLTVTDDNGCQVTLDTMVAAAEELIVSYTSVDPTCFGLNDGAIDLTVSGGTPDYNFDWGGTFSEDLDNLSADDYSVTITYNNNLCEHIENVQLIEPQEMAIAPQTTNVSCNEGADGSILLNASGGTGDLTYDWSNGASTDMLSSLTAGEYGVTITDENNCMVSFIDTIVQPDQLVVTADIQRAGCKVENDGNITLNVIGGIAPFTYDWSNGTSDQNANDLVTNNYQVTVEDANGCIVEEDLLVAEADTIFTASFLAASGLIDVDSVEVNADDVIHFRDISYPNPNAWEWSFGDALGSTSTEPNPAFSYANNPDEEESEYFAKLIVSNQYCTDSLQKAIRITNNFRIVYPDLTVTYLDFTQMTAFPNPTSDQITVRIGMTREEEVELTIFDTAGRLLSSRDLSGGEFYEETIDVSDLADGMYFIRAKALNKVHTLKMIVVKN